jgi:hypothetical protein
MHPVSSAAQVRPECLFEEQAGLPRLELRGEQESRRRVSC